MIDGLFYEYSAVNFQGQLPLIQVSKEVNLRFFSLAMNISWGKLFEDAKGT